MTVLTGAAAGIAGGVLMRLLEAVEHVAWNYEAGTLLEAATRAPASRYLLNLLGAGILVGVGATLIRKKLGRPGDADASIWFHSGRMPALSTLAQGVLSIVTVGMGTSLGPSRPSSRLAESLPVGWHNGFAFPAPNKECSLLAESAPVWPRRTTSPSAAPSSPSKFCSAASPCGSPCPLCCVRASRLPHPGHYCQPVRCTRSLSILFRCN